MYNETWGGDMLRLKNMPLYKEYEAYKILHPNEPISYGSWLKTHHYDIWNILVSEGKISK